MRNWSTDRPRSYWPSLLIATSLTLAGCGDKKKEPPPNEPEKPVATESPAQNPVQKQVPSAKDAPIVAADDPLLGLWEVVDVQGRYAEVNTGLVYDFKITGQATVRAIAVGPIPGGRLQAGVKKGDVLEEEWSWKRIADNEIELRHPDSPLVAVITTTIEGDTMKFEWNKAKGGSVFMMERIK